MCIFVRDLAGKIITLGVDGTDTIDIVKTKIQELRDLVLQGKCKEDLKDFGRYNIKDFSVLYLDGKRLEVGRTFADYDIRSGSILQAKMQIHVEKMADIVAGKSGRTITLEVDGSDTIYSLKAKILDEEAIPPGYQRLFYGKMLLEDDCTLDYYGMKSENVLHVSFSQPNRNRVRIYINTLTGKTITCFRVWSSTIIGNVKAKIHDEMVIPPSQQCLFFNGTLLEDGSTLADYSIETESTLSLQLAFPGAPGPRSKLAIPLLGGQPDGQMTYQNIFKSCGVRHT